MHERAAFLIVSNLINANGTRDLLSTYPLHIGGALFRLSRFVLRENLRAV
jgi:hypothetical protein